MDVAKAQFDLIPADALGQVSDYSSPIVAASAIRLVSRLRLADRVNPPVNVVISNVPGPRQPLYFAGARLDAYIPVSTVSDGIGLNITVHSYADRMDFGLISDRDLVPDLWHLVDLHIAEIDRLFEATGATRAVPQEPPAVRHGGDGVGRIDASATSTDAPDDIDASGDARPVTFALQGVAYSADLSQKDLDKLTKALSPFIQHAHKEPHRRTATTRRNANATTSRPYDLAALREWAAQNQVTVPARGRIPNAIIEQYKTATATPSSAPKRARTRAS